MYVNKKLNILFMGTPELSGIILEELIRLKYNVVCTITKPGKKQGRGLNYNISPVKYISEKYKILSYHPQNLDFENCQDLIYNLNLLNLDLIIVVSYGLLIPKWLLNISSHGAINIHFSILPKWRGAAPIQWSIASGEKFTGITIIKMNEKLDAGDIILFKIISIDKDDTYISLSNKLINLSKKCLDKVLKKFIQNNIKQTKQNLDVCNYARKLTKKDGKLNFNNDGLFIHNQIRAFNPWPGTYILLNNKHIKVLKISIIYNKYYFEKGTIIKIDTEGVHIQAKNDIIIVKELQFPGSKIDLGSSISIKNKLSNFIGLKCI